MRAFMASNVMGLVLLWGRVICLLAIICAVPGNAYAVRSSQPTELDFDGDGVFDEIQVQYGFDPANPVVGQVTVISGATGLPLLQVTGDRPNDGFGHDVIAVSDLTGDGVPELVVAVPRAFIQSDRVGRAYVYSGATGDRIFQLFGQVGDRIGFSLEPTGDWNADGFDEIIVHGMALDYRGCFVDRLLMFSGFDGQRLFDQTYPINGIPPVILPTTGIWGDLTLDGFCDSADIVLLAQFIASGSGLDRGGDLDRDGDVDHQDLIALIELAFEGDQQGDNTNPVDLTDQEWQQVVDTAQPWIALYPEDPITNSVNPLLWTGQQGAPNWWRNGWFNIVDGRNVPSWLTIETPEVLTPDYRGDRVSSLAIGPVPGDLCNAYVQITDCPEMVRIGEDFTVTADFGPACDVKYWIVQNGMFSSEPIYTAPTLSYRVDFAEATPGILIVTAYCEDTDGNCTASDSCTIQLEDCILELDGCPTNLVGGEGGSLTASAQPSGGVFTWSIVEGADALDEYSANGASFDFTTLIVPGGFVTIKVRYEINGCVKEQLCIFYVDPDTDGDGMSDDEEDFYAGGGGSSGGGGGGGGGGCNGCGGGCPSSSDPDSDDDCVSDSDEMLVYGSSPCNRDTDGDGVDDGVEVKLMAAFANTRWSGIWHPVDILNDPLTDMDHDGLPDVVEVGLPCVSEFITDPTTPDSDGDGIEDGCELASGFDPLDPTSPSEVPSDADGDGIPDEQEICDGTDPGIDDSDGDGLPDWLESSYMFCTNPLDPDTDNDGLTDGEEYNDGVVFFGLGTNPCDADSDDDGLPDGLEFNTAGLDPLDPDSDADGVNDGLDNNDSDTLTNLEEYLWGTNLLSSDTDGDGASDGNEVNGGSDPTDGSDGGVPSDDAVLTRLHIDSLSGHSSWLLTVGNRKVVCGWEGQGEADYYFQRGRSYPITIEHLQTDPTFFEWTCSNSFGYNATVEPVELDVTLQPFATPPGNSGNSPVKA